RNCGSRRRRVAILLVGGILIVYLILAWFIGTWLHLAGSSLWILRGTLAFLGVLASGLFLWWYYKVLRRAGSVAASAEAGSDDMDPLIADAIKRVRSAKQGISLQELPQLFVIGPVGAAKSSTIVNS